MNFKERKIRLILSNSDFGAGKKGAANGPEALRKELSNLGIQFEDFRSLNAESTEAGEGKFSKHIHSVHNSALQLNNLVQECIGEGEFPLLFTGDHSNAIGGLSGVKNAYPDKRIGVIWVDAHADLHSPYTTPSGNMHGMPLAVLLGLDNKKASRNQVTESETEAWEALKTIGERSINPKILATDLVFIGIRDAEKEEWELIKELNIKTFEPDDIKEHGIYYAINNAIKHLQNCDLIYVSFDVDSLDPVISTGTGTTAPDGLKFSEAEGVFKSLMSIPNLAGFEITEINPKLDTNGSRIMANAVASLFHYGYNK